MESSPVTPRWPLLPLHDYPSPLSPASSPNAKRKASSSFDSRVVNPWAPQPLTPPWRPEAIEETDRHLSKRACIARHRPSSNAAFADFEEVIDDTLSAHSQCETCVSPKPDAVDLEAAQNDLTSVLYNSREGSCNTYEDQAIDSILAGPSDDYLSSEASLYDGVEVGESGNDEICFGMIQVNPFELAEDLAIPSSSRNISRMNDLHLTQAGSVLYQENNVPMRVGVVRAPMLEILYRLGQQSGMSLQLHCILKHIPTSSGNRRSPGTMVQCKASLHANLYANLYGPLCAFDSIGEFLEACDVCLQDPEGCDRNVRYRNPHRISGRDESAAMTIDHEIVVGRSSVGSDLTSPDYLDGLAVHSELQMSDSPTILNTNLHQYQRQALFFMLTRERGWSFHDPFADIWTQTNIGGVRMYLNSITDEAQLEAPLPFRGGLLADQMGLGKTLTIISLIASDFYGPSETRSICRMPYSNLSSHYSKCTLVIVPPNLLDTWECQLKRHCQTDTIRWRRHHDKTRFSSLSEMVPYHIVLTTYNTVSAEWRSYKESSILYSTEWHRIVLDEAHCIKGEHNQLTKAICDLEACRRWAVTGTPIQNHLNDLEALLKFLRVYPYNKHVHFEHDITNFWKVDSEAAVARLKKLISCITLRRTSKAIQLPPKNELLFTLPFSQEERELYEPLEAKIINLANQANVHDSSAAASRAYALKGLFLLRSICNLGILTDTRKFLSTQNDAATWGSLDAQLAFDTLTMAAVTLCAKCDNDVTTANINASVDMFGEASLLSTDLNPMVAQCEQALCGICASSMQYEGVSTAEWCGHTPPCPTFSVSTPKTSVLPLSSLRSQAVDPSNLPTKIHELIRDICAHTDSKSVVFSCWRATLDLAAVGLDSAKIRFRRFDGDVRHDDRASILHDFDHDQTVRVLLITTTCGAVGLDLTSANRAYIMEPQWNPTVEDQALSRIHRMGQQKPVTIIRFVMADSIEQRVMEVKNNKKNFAELLFAAKKKSSHLVGAGTHFDFWRTLLN